MIIFRVIGSVLFSAMAAYAFARLNFPGKKFFFSLVLIQMMVPGQLFIIPQFNLVQNLGLLNTVTALVIPGVVSAFGTFLLRQFFMGIPAELEEAAKLDGCSIGRTFFTIMLPLANSGLVALGIFTALFAFKDLMWPLIVNMSIDKNDAICWISLITRTVLNKLPAINGGVITCHLANVINLYRFPT